MPSFSKASIDRLNTCDSRLQKILHEVIKVRDFTVLCGHRDKEAQDEAYKNGITKLKWPHSKHNVKPSLAVDVAPYPIDWKDTKRFRDLWFLIDAEAKKQGVTLRSGADWDMDGDDKDEKFLDYPHVEIDDA